MLLALAGGRARAVGGGAPDADAVPVIQALRAQVDVVDHRFLVLTASMKTSDLREL